MTLHAFKITQIEQEKDMAFLDALGKKITQTGQDVVQKTKETAEVMKFTSLIADEERRMECLYQDIGRHYFALHSESAEEPFTDMVLELKQAQEKITEYNEAIKKIKGISYCPHCNSQIPHDAVFCSTCGAKLEKIVPVDADTADAGRACPTCGSTMPEGYIFCANCGTRYAEDANISEDIHDSFENE